MNTALSEVTTDSVDQYIKGAQWLRENVGKGAIWRNPPEYPNRSAKQWWANGHFGKYSFWIKDQNLALVFQLSLPAP